MSPVRLSSLAPLNIIVPARTNTRFGRLNEYFSTHGVTINRMMELDRHDGHARIGHKGRLGIDPAANAVCA